jgi:hypothetical protein
MPNDNRTITFAEAICEATDFCLNEDPSVYLIGLGVSDPGAISAPPAACIKDMVMNALSRCLHPRVL